MGSAEPDQHVTATLAKWIATTDNATIPTKHLERAKYLILDGIACALVGAKLPWSVTATRALLKAEPAGSCSIIGWGNQSFGPLSAALINSTYIQGFELDDYHSGAPLHSNALLLPALFAAVEGLCAAHEARPTGLDFLRAYVVGCEVGPRVGLALHGKDLLTRGWHSGAIQGPSAAAAAASNLLSLSAQQTEWALGIACTQAGGLMSAQFGSMAKRMQHGFASRNGLLAVILAREGYTGIESVYETEYGGFLSMFSRDSAIGAGKPSYLPTELTRGLGERWEIDAVRVKLHAAMAGLHGTIDCVEMLQKQHPDRFEEGRLHGIEQITTEHGDASYHHGGFIAPEDKPLSSTAAQMSIQYAAAAQLIDHQVLMAQFGADRLNRPSVRRLMSVVRPTHNVDFDSSPDATFKTKITVAFNDGTSLTSAVNAPKGINPPVSNEDIVVKWRRLVAGVITDQRQTEIENIVLGLENLGSEGLMDLLALLKGDVKCPIQT